MYISMTMRHIDSRIKAPWCHPMRCLPIQCALLVEDGMTCTIASCPHSLITNPTHSLMPTWMVGVAHNCAARGHKVVAWKQQPSRCNDNHTLLGGWITHKSPTDSMEPLSPNKLVCVFWPNIIYVMQCHLILLEAGQLSHLYRKRFYIH